MANASAFECACEVLEHDTGLERLAARGTVRIALKEAGLDAQSVQPTQMAVVVQRVLPELLRARGVETPEVVCTRIRERLAKVKDELTAESPDAVFRRLGG
jgi:hypothetical protein